MHVKHRPYIIRFQLLGPLVVWEEFVITIFYRLNVRYLRKSWHLRVLRSPQSLDNNVYYLKYRIISCTCTHTHASVCHILPEIHFRINSPGRGDTLLCSYRRYVWVTTDESRVYIYILSCMYVARKKEHNSQSYWPK